MEHHVSFVAGSQYFSHVNILWVFLFVLLIVVFIRAVLRLDSQWLNRLLLILRLRSAHLDLYKVLLTLMLLQWFL